MKKTVTLIELLLALSVMGVIVSASVVIESAARRFLRSADLTVVATNEASYILDHIQSRLSLAHGNLDTAGVFTGLVPAPPFINQQQLRIYRDGGDLNSTADDYWVTYRLNVNSVEYRVGAGTWEILSSNHITQFRFDSTAGDSAVSVTVRARFFPAIPIDSKLNPEVELSTVIYLTQHSAS